VDHPKVLRSDEVTSLPTAPPPAQFLDHLDSRPPLYTQRLRVTSLEDTKHSTGEIHGASLVPSSSSSSESSTLEMKSERQALESAIHHSEQERLKLEHEKQELEGERGSLERERLALKEERERWEKAREDQCSPRRILGGRPSRPGVSRVRKARVLGDLAQHSSRLDRSGRLYEHARRNQGCYYQAT
jgi:septal ring factor EnvC (AmiA/AmiB activator)